MKYCLLSVSAMQLFSSTQNLTNDNKFAILYKQTCEHSICTSSTFNY